MKYTLNDKTIIIPDKELDKLVSTLDISMADAIDLWLDDNGYKVNEIAQELDEKAKKAGIEHETVQKPRKKSEKPREKKVSDEKKTLFNGILNNLKSIYQEKVTILNENKLISVKIGEKTFKIDIIECRPLKK